MSIKIDALQAAFATINQPRDFEVGDLVTWKDEALRNALYPNGCKDFGICVRFEEPVRGNSEPGSNRYCDMKDMVFGIIDDDGDYSEFTASSRRMKKFVE